MTHICPKCGGVWDCKSCTEDLVKEKICSIEKLCRKCRRQDQPCGCENCEYIRRFGCHPENDYAKIYNRTCVLCGEWYREHKGWRCPSKKTEWELPNGARLIRTSDFEFKIIGIFNCNELSPLIKALQEIKALREMEEKNE